MVFSGLVMLWRLAGWPTRTWPSSVKATIDGVVRPPSAFSITLALFPSITATQELVVPRSMPIAFAMTRLLIQKMRVTLSPFQTLFDQYAGRARRVGRKDGQRVPRLLGGLKRPPYSLAWPLP